MHKCKGAQLLVFTGSYEESDDEHTTWDFTKESKERCEPKWQGSYQREGY